MFAVSARRVAAVAPWQDWNVSMEWSVKVKVPIQTVIGLRA